MWAYDYDQRGNIIKTMAPLENQTQYAHRNEKRARRPFFDDLQTSIELCRSIFGAGNETRTRDPDLGKVVLYQLSYSRVVMGAILAIWQTTSTP
ncbi:hypothetical protein IAE37_002538 [Pseudomonas sp. S31]|nr:hypothetical protein [Pseudomonas sp. S31]